MPIQFLLWVFKNYCSSDYGNYGHSYEMSEHGISKDDFLLENTDAAAQDAKNFLSCYDTHFRRHLVSKWREDCYEKAAALTEAANTEFEV